MKYVRTLTLKESIERWPVVEYVKNSPQAQASLLAGLLALVGGSLKLAATTQEFNSEVFMTKTDGEIIRLKCKKVPTIKCSL